MTERIVGFRTLVTADELARHLDDPSWGVVDCRFSLGDPERGRRDYLVDHVAGAVYAHLDDDLAAPVIPGKTGRHPLPEVDVFARRLSAWGIGDGVQVVAYDDSAGSMAARLWWMLRWLGHDEVAVLDGGWQAWRRAGLPTRNSEETRSRRQFVSRPRPSMVVDADDVARKIGDPSFRLLDARAVNRFRGQDETIDPIAGHIPSAISAPYADNLGPDGRFHTPEELRQRFEALLGGVPAERTASYCGSGVSAAHNLLALAHAGLDHGKLYAGSWSDWITDSGRPVAVGERAE